MTKRIKVTQGSVTLVDDEDYAKLVDHCWYVNSSGYVYRHVLGGRNLGHVAMHREIMNAPENAVVDHINHNPLDNRKKNLRLATYSQNAVNSNKRKRHSPGVPCTSKYKGVTWAVTCNRWVAQCWCDNQKYHLGTWKTEEQAALAYNNKAVELWGSYAKLNEIPKGTKLTQRKYSSQYYGVSYSNAEGKYVAQFQYQQTKYRVGWFTDELSAAKAYDEKAREVIGATAKLNFPSSSS